jgi:sulfite reductase (NADPH) hemoprotein beta-component
MYLYDKYDQAMVDARVAEFRDQAQRRLDGKITEDQFKPLRLACTCNCTPICCA